MAADPIRPETVTPDALAPARRTPPRPADAPHEALRPIAPVSDRAGDDLTDERIAEIRARIAAGVYDSREVAEALAQRLLESGDL